MNLSVNCVGVDLVNPLVLASGLLGTTGASMASVIRAGAGAVTTKTIFLRPRKGHANPTVIHLGGGNCINAVGLPAGGLETGLTEIASFRKLSQAPIIASIGAEKLMEWSETARRVAEEGQPDALECDISCPNVDPEMAGTALDPVKTERVVREIRRGTKLPFFAKLSPNAPNIVDVAKAAEAAGADGLTVANSVGPGMVIDIDARRPVLANKVGGLSGPAIRPIAVRCVFQVSQAVRIPIIGTGGVATGRDVIEMIMAGSTLVGLGSSIAHRGPTVFRKITKEMEKWCEENGVQDVAELRGAAWDQ